MTELIENSIFTKAQVKLVSKVDMWGQENNPRLDKEFQMLYSGDDGWEGVAKNRPASFARALALAIEYKDKVEE